MGATICPQLFRAAQIIADVLGPLSESVFLDPGWSKGRTTSSSGKQLAALYKYDARPDITKSALKYGLAMLQQSPHWGQAALDADGPVSVLSRGLNVVEGNVMIFVPKNAKTDRSIAYEPHLNIRLQRSVGEYLARRLRKFGVMLDDQSVNQRKCRRAAKHGDLATVDLSMASDTLALELIYELLPIDWAIFLDDLRSKKTLWPDGTLIRNEKFSSMGNGFTFELESLIFYALARTCAEDVSVYGDDIIIPVESVPQFSILMDFCGFRLNSDKTFTSSYFRESCGSDNFSRLDCTPVYLRSLPKTLEDVVKLHNSVAYWLRRYPLGILSIEKLLEKWRKRFPFLCGPYGFGDGHYHTPLETMVLRDDRHGCELKWFRTVVRRSRVSPLYGDLIHGSIPFNKAPAAICAALGPPKGTTEAVSEGSLINNLTDPRQFRYKTIWVPVHAPWLVDNA